MPRLVLPSAGQPAELDQGSIFFIGNATVLLRCAGFTVLTDPSFLHKGERASLGYGLLHMRRRTDPAIDLDALPKIDLVLLSHQHEDHFDRRVARGPDEDTRTLARRGFRRTIPLETWKWLDVARGDRRIRITAMPGAHGLGPIRWLLPRVMGCLVEIGSAGNLPLVRLYVSGDTLDRALRQIPRRHPDIDIALLHLGGTRVLGVFVTMDARQGVQALRVVSPRVAVPIHCDDYDRFKSPLADFQREVRSAGLEDRVRYLLRGETLIFELPRHEHRAVTSPPGLSSAPVHPAP
jgi:L-ascorbate metabolism protein UlaG (beta-lactamase superfamily)